jgi:mevalonate kinase
MNQATASAPGKLMLFGEHAVVYGFPCIVTAVDQRLYVTVKKNGVNKFHMEAPDLGLEAYSKTIDDLGKKDLPKAVRFIEMLYKRFLDNHPQEEGIDVITKSDFSSSFGFGSSSAVTVAFAKALTQLYGRTLSNKELFDLCYQAVLDVQGVGSGFDIAAAIWGGTIYYVPPAKVVQKVDIDDIPLIVGYTGVKADTPTLVRMVAQLQDEDKDGVTNIWKQIETIVNQAKVAIEKKDWQQVGQLMNQNHTLLKQLNVSSVELERLINSAIESGAYGAKLSGAGGGDCMLALNGGQKCAVALNQAQGEVLEVSINAQGARTEE